MREEDSPLNGEERKKEDFPLILWEKKYSGGFDFPESRESMENHLGFYSEIKEWRNDMREDDLMGIFHLPPEGMNPEIYSEIHQLILMDGIPFIDYIQSFLHIERLEFRESMDFPEDLREDYSRYLNSI